MSTLADLAVLADQGPVTALARHLAAAAGRLATVPLALTVVQHHEGLLLTWRAAPQGRFLTAHVVMQAGAPVVHYGQSSDEGLYLPSTDWCPIGVPDERYLAALLAWLVRAEAQA